MDNLTHTLVGFIAGETIARTTRTRDSALAPDTRRGLFVALTAIGGNLPDLDLLYSYHDYSPAKLGYLLQHRGYTHTVLGCLLLAALLYVGAECWARWRRLSLSRGDRIAIAVIAPFSTLLHLSMDFLNSYGVHPFWPADDRWFYGDAVFIVEPLYWAAAVPLFFVTRSMAWRLAIAVPIVAAPVVGLLLHLVVPLNCALFALLVAAALAVGKRLSPRVLAVTGATAALLVTVTFAAAGQYASRRLESLAGQHFPAERVIDRILSPEPMNPLCWDVLLLATEGDRYSIRRAVLSDAPALIEADRCPSMMRRGAITAPLSTVTAPSSVEIEWSGQFVMSREVLASLVASDCSAGELMQFARAPFAAELDQHWVIGDLRFDREPGLGMSEIELAAQHRCPRPVPWIPPRADLLR